MSKEKAAAPAKTKTPKVILKREINPQICRICEEKDALVDLTETVNYHLLVKLQQIEGPRQSTDAKNFDEIFKYICYRCENALQGYYAFRSKIRIMRLRLMNFAITGRISVERLREPKNADKKPEKAIDDYLEEVLQPDPGQREESNVIAEPEFIEVDIDAIKIEQFMEESAVDVPEDTSWKEIYRPKTSPKPKNEKLILKTVEETKIKCSQCKEKFKDQRSLANHLMRTHRPESQKKPVQKTQKNRKCPFCGQIFDRMFTYLEHLRLHDASLFKCKYCAEEYKSRLNCRIHEMGHRERDFNTEQHLKQLKVQRANVLVQCVPPLRLENTKGTTTPSNPTTSTARTCMKILHLRKKRILLKNFKSEKNVKNAANYLDT